MATFVAVSVALAWLQVSASPRTGSRVGQTATDAIWVVALGATTATLLRWGSLRRVPWSVAQAVGLLCPALLALGDVFYLRIFGGHLDRHTVALAWNGWRTGSVRLGPMEYGQVVGSVVLLGVFVFALGGMFTWLPRLGERAERGARGVTAALAALAVGLVVLRDFLAPPTSAWAEPLHWYSPHQHVATTDAFRDGVDIAVSGDLTTAHWREVESVSSALRAHSFPVLAERHVNVLFVHVESLRGEMLAPAFMPKLDAWRSRCSVSKRHYSTSNTTGGGLFGAMNGLSAAYFSAARAHPIGSTPLRVLDALGYARHAWYPNQALDFDGYFTTIFGDTAEAHVSHALPVHVADEKTVDAFLSSIAASASATAAANTPRFDFMLIDSTHYDYSYPQAFEKHLPTATLGLVLNPLTGEAKGIKTQAGEREAKSEGVFNRYKNSVLYADSLLDRVLRAMDRLGVLDETFVAIFGDHGESFWDNGGSFGHSTALTDAQTRVPLMLCGAFHGPLAYETTSHADLFPTLFDVIGLDAPRPFMSGRSLLKQAPERDYVVLRQAVYANENEERYALVRGDRKYHYRDGATLMRTGAVFDRNDHEVENTPREELFEVLMLAAEAKRLREPAPLSPAPARR